MLRKEKIHFWSEAVKKKAELVRLTNIAFQELSQNETNNVYLWARATKEFQKSLNDFGLALEIIQNNDNNIEEEFKVKEEVVKKPKTFS